MHKYLTITAILGATAVILGAFGSHALKELLTEQALASYQVAVRYQMYHVLLLLFINISNYLTDNQKKLLNILLIIGVVFFSGSIYTIQLLGVSSNSIWFITPLGGVLLIGSWLLLAFYFLKKVSKKT
ncbi:MAG: DUF423 domain-containing protein [Tenacibaculum sp.]